MFLPLVLSCCSCSRLTTIIPSSARTALTTALLSTSIFPRRRRRYHYNNNNIVVTTTKTTHTSARMSSNRSAVAAVTATATATRGGGESISSSNSSINGSRGRMLTSASTSTAVVATATARSNIVAIAQLRSTSDKFQNLLNVAKCARMALDLGQEHQQQQKEEEQKQPSLSALASQHQQQQRQQQQAKVKMLFLPECFGFIGSSSSQTLTEAEDPIFLVNSNNNEHGQQWKNNYKTEQEYQQQFNVHQILKAIIHNENENDKNNKWALNSKDTDTDTTIKNAATVTPPPKVISLIDGLRTIAKESGLWISGGGIHIAGAPPLASPPLPATRNDDNTTSSTSTNHKNHNEKGRVYNTHIIINSDGAIVAQYNKIHLFDVSIPTQNIHLRESSSTAPGTQLVSCASPIGRLGLSTCYDLRFPEVYTQLTTNTNHNAQILLVPSAFTIPTGAAHWHTLLRARAIENQCYVLAAAQYGIHNEKRNSFGHSLAVDPWGKVLADAGGYSTPMNGDDDDNNSNNTAPEPPSIVTVEIDLSLTDSIRQRMPIQLHRSNATFESN